MRRVINKIISAEIGYIHHETIYVIKKHKGILLDVVSKKYLSKKKTTDRLWISFETASKLKLIPKNYDILTDEEINMYLRDKIINKTLTLKASIRKKIKF